MTTTLDKTTKGSHALDVEQTTALLVQRAHDLRELLQSHAAETESNRRVPDVVIDALSRAGLFKISTPRRFGGYELPFRSSLEINAAIGEGDGSTAWVTTLTNVCNWMVGLFPDQAQRDVFENRPDARVCGVVAPTSTAIRVGGGLRVTGKWSPASGSASAQWAGLGVPIVDESGAQVDQGFALFPMEDLIVEDTWFVAGMQGSASNTLVADNVFVPDHRIISVSRATEGDYATEHKDEALYRSAFIPVMALVLIGPVAGVAKASLDYVLASLAKGKGISYTFYEHSTDAASTQLSMAEAAILVDTCYLHMQRAASAIDEAAAANVYPSRLERARARMDTGYIARKAREAIDILLNVNGSGSMAQASPLQRMWRDANTGSRHAVINSLISAEAFGRELLGVQEQITPLI
ncbi:MAG TPA: acyl-CoA dehydrogenase family protein [Galbitalea sp.]|jgi:alkylation response protein AidB-like acyl-CoA dehydrogenase|nr:acyl-CoA dehydrogenase family protein [Galbitalea sp.]